jgi:hypothetical protein
VDHAARPARPTPRRLRLPELLVELGAIEHELEQAAKDQRAATKITVGEIVDKAQEAGFGFVICVFAVIAIPFFGLSTPFGLAIALCGLQMLIGRTRPWLPGFVRRRPLKLSMLDRSVHGLTRWTGWLSRLTRRRWEPLLVGPMNNLVGLSVLLLGLGLALPLPIPGSNLIFLVPVLVFGIGLLERDGVLVAIGHFATLIDMVVLAVFGRTVAEVVIRAFAWIG